MSRKSRQRQRRLHKLAHGCNPDGTPAIDAQLAIKHSAVEVMDIPHDIQRAIEKRLRERGIVGPEIDDK
jgi:hypothetical protein